MNAEESTLRAGLAQLQLELNDKQVGQLLDYLKLIAKWTKVYNLTAVRDPAEMMTHHLLDSLAVISICSITLLSANAEISDVLYLPPSRLISPA